jgi:hypothetical protein
MASEFPFISSLDELIAYAEANPLSKSKVGLGATEDQIQQLEKSLNVQLPASLRSALLKLDLCSFLFGNTALDICIEGVRPQKSEVLSAGMILFGSSDNYLYYVSLDDEVYLQEIGLNQYVPMGCNLVEFICRVATFTHPMWKAYRVSNWSSNLIETLLDELEITKCFWFWNMLASGVI